MEEKYIWDLTHIYNSKEDVYKSIEEAYNLLEQIKVYKGKLKGDLQQRWNATYNYGDEQGAVLGVLGRGCFTPRRIQVIQMISP